VLGSVWPLRFGGWGGEVEITPARPSIIGRGWPCPSPGLNTVSPRWLVGTSVSPINHCVSSSGRCKCCKARALGAQPKVLCLHPLPVPKTAPAKPSPEQESMNPISNQGLRLGRIVNAQSPTKPTFTQSGRRRRT
jgi:hypothetical protein